MTDTFAAKRSIRATCLRTGIGQLAFACRKRRSNQRVKITRLPRKCATVCFFINPALFSARCGLDRVGHFPRFLSLKHSVAVSVDQNVCNIAFCEPDFSLDSFYNYESLNFNDKLVYIGTLGVRSSVRGRVHVSGRAPCCSLWLSRRVVVRALHL